jgi:hypothetical protein
MPNLRLANGDVETLIKFLEEQTASHARTAANHTPANIEAAPSKTNK